MKSTVLFRRQGQGLLGASRVFSSPRIPPRRKCSIRAVAEAIDFKVAKGRSASPLVLEWETGAGLLYVGIDGPMQRDRPGNGGLRVWQYDSAEEAIAECRILASTMSQKHEVYNTGFSGAKLVLNARSDISGIDRDDLMAKVSEALHELQGTVYTGCDLNTSMDDMEQLTGLCPYVLASVSCLTDANEATGHGVFAAIEAVTNTLGGMEGKTVLVKGCGKVGGCLANLLVQAGTRVLTFDLIKEVADIPGCTNISEQDWKSVPCDILAPCSTTGFITEDVAKSLKTRFIVGSSNAPVANADAMGIIESRGIVFVPEAISSAGAILADSIEHFDAQAYRTAKPSYVYAYVRTLVKAKTEHLLALSARAGKPASSLLGDVKTDPLTPAVGSFYSQWLEGATQEYDVLVVGGGMAGTATAYWLSKLAPQLRGVVLESRSIAHKGGSSFGDSRMFRQMYSDPYFSKMQSVALDMWAELEREADVKLLKAHGLLFYGETDTGETVEGSVKGVAETCAELKLEHEYLQDKDEMQKRWGQMLPRDNYEGVYESAAGSVNSSLACETMMRLAREQGWNLMEHAWLDDASSLKEGAVEVLTSNGKILKAKKLVLCAGAWTNEVLKRLGLKELNLEVWNVHWGHYRVDPQLASSYPQWFCFKKEQPESWDGGLYYGFPPEAVPPETEDPTIKVGIDFTPEHPKFRTRYMRDFAYEPDKKIVSLMDQFLNENWKGVGDKKDMQANPYTMTSDGYFVLDKLPDHPEISIFTGGSGRAFKFAPLIGRCIADLVLDSPPSYNLSPMRVTRDAVAKLDSAE